MSLHARKDEIPVRRRVQPGGGTGMMTVQKVYGNECSLMIATRPPGYHSKPHSHESDQIIHVLKGEHWWFVEDKGYHCNEGDFLRIPRNKIQWDWNRSPSDSVVIETHSPPMIGGPSGEQAVALFDDGEIPQIARIGTNKYAQYDFETVERKYK